MTRRLAPAPLSTEPAQLVTVRQAAGILALSRDKVYELAAAGHLTKRYLPGSTRSFRLSLAEVRRFSAELAAEPED